MAVTLPLTNRSCSVLPVSFIIITDDTPLMFLYKEDVVSVLSEKATFTAGMLLLEVPKISMKRNGKKKPKTNDIGLLNCPFKLALITAIIALN